MRELGRRAGMGVHLVAPAVRGGRTVSSTAIRGLLGRGLVPQVQGPGQASQHARIPGRRGLVPASCGGPVGAFRPGWYEPDFGRGSGWVADCLYTVSLSADQLLRIHVILYPEDAAGRLVRLRDKIEQSLGPRSGVESVFADSVWDERVKRISRHGAKLNNR